MVRRAVSSQGRRKKPVARVKRKSGSTALTSFENIRKVALGLPGVVDSTSYGTTALKVGGKVLARLHQSLECVVLRTELLDREILMQSAPDAFFITDHYRDYPWILLRFGVVEYSALPDLIERAWRLVASKTLIKKRDERLSS